MDSDAVAGSPSGSPPSVATVSADLFGGTEDARRARELYRYYRPANVLSASQTSEPDTVLSAYCQLVALRLNVQRCLVSLFDRETQYFVAESTKTLNLGDQEDCEDPRDARWATCDRKPKAGSLCEHTLKTLAGPDGPACFEVLDLSNDDRFSRLSFVQDLPHFRYYCGVPIRTKHGIRIGSLYGLDVEAHRSLSLANRKFLTKMADNVMTHLEMMNEKQERRRALKMNASLAAFVENPTRKRKRASPFREAPGRFSNLPNAETAQYSSSSTAAQVNMTSEPSLSRPDSPSKTSRNWRTEPASSSKEVSEYATAHESRSIVGMGDDGIAPRNISISQTYNQQAVHVNSPADADPDPDRGHENTDIRNTFQRASTLLYQSLSLEDGGGVAFLDTMSSLENGHGLDTGFEHTSNSNSSDTATLSPSDSVERGSREKEGVRVTVLGAAGSDSRHLGEPQGFKALYRKDLLKLVKRHPKGKTFTLDIDGISGFSLSGEDSRAHDLRTSGQDYPSEKERRLLLHHFPGARQVIFLPLWDPTTSRWFGGFVYNTSEFHDIARHGDLLHCIAFCNCVITEISRLATLAADQQKTDFIGSISHELRSPLHGILASMEFLADTECCPFQKSLVDTADSCARTLLDTINMVLDFSRLNAFERNANKVKKSTRQKLASPQNIYEDVDLAAIVEEVIDGVATGQLFKDITSSETATLAERRLNDVGIILDISAKQWSFVTQPGAFRRIVMNLFGNSLKYTKSGSIQVKLDTEDASESKVHETGKTSERSTPTYVVLTVTDTGQGISPEFMRNRLFVPFAQESSLTPGTGLGLSLVKSIVHQLNGDINVKSTLGVGTEVTVRLAMSKGSGKSVPSTPTSAGSIAGIVSRADSNNGKIDSLSHIQKFGHGKKAVLFRERLGSAAALHDNTVNLMHAALIKYFCGWFGFLDVEDWHPDCKADVVVVDDLALPLWLKQSHNPNPSLESRPIVLVLCSNVSSYASSRTFVDASELEFITQPLGPYKIAHALRAGFEKRDARTLANSSVPVLPISSMSADDPDTIEPIIEAMQDMAVRASTNGASQTPFKHDIELGSYEIAHVLDLNGAGKSDGGEGDEAFPFPASHKDAAKPQSEPSSSCVTLQSVKTTIASVDSQLALSSLTFRSAPDVSAIPTLSRQPTLSKDSVTAFPRTPRVLLVDDNAINLKLLQTFVLKFGIPSTHTFSAIHGAQAVDVFRAQSELDPRGPPDMVFMDISMPVMDGFEASRRIRELESEDITRHERGAQVKPNYHEESGRNTRALIVALTGLASARDRDEAFSCGVDVYLTKPVRFKEVGRLIEAWSKGD